MTATSRTSQVESLLELDRYDEAAALAAQLVAQEPEHARLWCLLAQAHLGADRYAESLAAADQAVALSPDEEWPHRLRSNALRHLGRHREARFAAAESVRLAPHLWQAHVTVAHAASAMGDHATARYAADQAVTLAPGLAETHATAGYVRMGQDDHAAERALLRALEIDPTHAEALNNLGVVQLARKQTGPAMRVLQQAIVTDPRMEVARRNVDRVLGAVLHRVQVFVGIAAYLLVRVTVAGAHIDDDGSLPWTTRATLVFIAVVVVGTLSWRKLNEIPASLRPYAVSHLRTNRLLGASVMLSGLAVLLFVGIALPSASLSRALGLSSVVAVLLAYLLHGVNQRRTRVR